MMAMKLSKSLSQTATRFTHPRSHIPLKSRLFGPSSFDTTRNYSTAPMVLEKLHSLPNPYTPWLMLPPEVDKDNKVVDCFYSPEANQVVKLNREKSFGIPDSAKCIASTRGWLGFMEPKGEFPIYLTNPFRGKDTITLPPLSSLPFIAGIVHDPKTGTVVRVKEYVYFDESDEDDTDSYREFTPKQLLKEEVISIALSHSDVLNESCVVAATFGLDVTNLAYNLIGKSLKTFRDDHYWEQVHPNGPDMCFTEKEVTFSNKTNLFYGVENCDDDENGRIIEIHAFDFYDENGESKRCQCVTSFRIDRLLEEEFKREKSAAFKLVRNMCVPLPYLVCLENGDILYIMRHVKHIDVRKKKKKGDNEDEDKNEDEDEEEGYGLDLEYKTFLFDVFRVDFHNKQLERVETLGDRAIFIGSNNSFSLSTRNHPGLHRNSIYFTDHTHLGKYFDNCEVGIYNLEKSSILPCYPIAEGEKEVPPSYRNKLVWVSPLYH